MTEDLVGSRNETSRRGSAAKSTEPRFLVIGEVRKPHGVRGEVRVTAHTDTPERFTWLKSVYVGSQDPRPVVVEAVRFHGATILLKLAGYDDRNAAEALRGQWLQVPEDEAIPLEEGQYYLYQLQGLKVVTESGEQLGVLIEVIETRANNVFLVKGPRGEILLPDIEEVIRHIDFEGGRMTIRPMPGLLPD